MWWEVELLFKYYHKPVTKTTDLSFWANFSKNKEIYKNFNFS